MACPFCACPWAATRAPMPNESRRAAPAARSHGMPQSISAFRSARSAGIAELQEGSAAHGGHHQTRGGAVEAGAADRKPDSLAEPLPPLLRYGRPLGAYGTHAGRGIEST